MALLNLIKTLLNVLIICTITSETGLASSLKPSNMMTVSRMATISAEPAVLPFPPVPSPATGVSPDIAPLFPTPISGSATPPTESSMPIIPSSPSPPNPDDLVTPHPDEFSVSPTASMLESCAFVLHLHVSTSLFLAVWILFALW